MEKVTILLVTDNMDRRDASADLLIEIRQKGDELRLALAVVTLPVDSAVLGVKGGKQLQCPRPFVFMLYAVGDIARSGRLGVMAARPGLKRCLLVH